MLQSWCSHQARQAAWAPSGAQQLGSKEMSSISVCKSLKEHPVRLQPLRLPIWCCMVLLPCQVQRVRALSGRDNSSGQHVGQDVVARSGAHPWRRGRRRRPAPRAAWP